MRYILSLVLIVTAPLILTALVGAKPAEALSDGEIVKLIENASTPEEHLKLAEYYESQAKKMDAEATRHEAMKKAYEKRSKIPTHMPKHCAKLIAKDKEAAEEYRSMAEVHRYLAADTHDNE